MTTFEKIKELCEAEGFAVTAISEHIEGIHVTSAAVTGWKKGAKPRPRAIQIIAEHFGKPISYFTDDETEKVTEEPNAVELPSKGIHMLPLYESVSAGFGASANDCVIDYVPVFFSSPINTDDYIVVKVRGNSMQPKIEDGDNIVVNRCESVDSGTVAVVSVESSDFFVKKVNYGENWIELESFNAHYPTMRFEGKDVLLVRVLGRVVKIEREL